MKKIQKNLLLGMGTISTVVAPVAAVVACGTNTTGSGSKYIMSKANDTVHVFIDNKENSITLSELVKLIMDNISANGYYSIHIPEKGLSKEDLPKSDMPKHQVAVVLGGWITDAATTRSRLTNWIKTYNYSSAVSNNCIVMDV